MFFDVIAKNKAVLPDQLTLPHLVIFLTFLVLIIYLTSHSDICNQVRLNALSASQKTSTWLKATLIPSLGLDIPGSEFIWSTAHPTIFITDHWSVPVHNSLINMEINLWVVAVELIEKKIQHSERCNISWITKMIRLNNELMVTRTPDLVIYISSRLQQWEAMFFWYFSLQCTAT